MSKDEVRKEFFPSVKESTFNGYYSMLPKARFGDTKLVDVIEMVRLAAEQHKESPSMSIDDIIKKANGH
jgi:hypothetical protein